MPDLTIEAADAVVADLNDPANTFGHAFKALRGYLPRLDAQQLVDQTWVMVVPIGEEREAFERQGWSSQIIVAVAVMTRLSSSQGDGLDEVGDLGQLDSLIHLVGAFKDLFARDAGYLLETPHGLIACTGLTNEPLLFPEDLDRRLFHSVVHLTFQLIPPGGDDA